MKNKNPRGFVFFELVGSIMMLLIDPQRLNHKKYLDQKYYNTNRIVGIMTTVLLILGSVIVLMR